MQCILLFAILAASGRIYVAGEQEQLAVLELETTENPECGEAIAVDCFANVPPRNDPEFCDAMYKLSACLKEKMEICAKQEEKDELNKELLKFSDRLDKICGKSTDSEEGSNNCLADQEEFQSEIMACTLSSVFALATAESRLSEADAKCLLAINVIECVEKYVKDKCGEEYASELRKEMETELYRELSLDESHLCNSSLETEEQQQETDEDETQQETDEDETQQETDEDETQQETDEDLEQTFEMNNEILRKKRFLF